jgi:hypothetical protein
MAALDPGDERQGMGRTHRPEMEGAMNYPNPYTTVIPGDCSYSFTAMANAAYFQRAIISLGGQQAAVFNGQGEGVPMTTAGGATSNDGDNNDTDGTNYSNAVVAEVLSTPKTLMVGTEDSNDGDNNDTVLTLSIARL